MSLLLLFWGGRNRHGLPPHHVFPTCHLHQKDDPHPTTSLQVPLPTSGSHFRGLNPRLSGGGRVLCPLHHPYALKRERPLKKNWNKRTVVCVRERKKICRICTTVTHPNSWTSARTKREVKRRGWW